MFIFDSLKKINTKKRTLMKNKLKLIVISAVCVLGVGYSLVTASTNGLDLWMSGSNNNKLVEIQSQKTFLQKIR